jgi:hypothetical protein
MCATLRRSREIVPLEGFRMRYRLKAAVAALSIAFLTACPPTTGPTEELDVDLRWGIERLQTEPAFVVEPGTGEIVIRGYFETPCTPYAARAVADLTDNHVSLVLYARQPEGCRQAIDTVGYEATIHGVPPRTYTLFVSHTYHTGATELFMADSQVAVP